jgi:hypothetical protein
MERETKPLELVPATALGWTLTLRATTDPIKAAKWATRNFCNLIAYGRWSTDAMLAIVMWRDANAIRLSGWVTGGPPDALADIAYAAAPIGVIRPSGKLPKLGHPLMEIVPTRVVSDEIWRDPGEEQRFIERNSDNAIPAHVPDDLRDMAHVLLTVPGAAIGMFMKPATTQEQHLADELYGPTLLGRTTVQQQMYRGTPLCARTILYSGSGHIPGRQLAEFAMIAQRTEARELDRQDRIDWRKPAPNLLAAFPMYLDAAMAIVHLPAAGEGRPVPGMKLLPPAPHIMAYDAPPKPENAIRIGRAPTSKGKKKGVFVGPADLPRHIWTVAKTGAGKSTFLRGLVAEAIQAGFGVVVLDPHGSLCLDIMGDAPDPDRLLYVDFSNTSEPTQYNSLYAKNDEIFEARLQAVIAFYVDRDSEEYTGPVWRAAFEVVARGCRKVFGQATLVQVFTILGNRDLVRLLAEAVAPLDRTLSQRIMSELGNRTGPDNTSMWGWLAAKGSEILGSSAFVKFLGTGVHAFDMQSAMAESKVVLVNMGLAQLGERTAELLGGTLIGEGRHEMLTRTDRSKPILWVIDEGVLFQYGALPVDDALRMTL